MNLLKKNWKVIRFWGQEIKKNIDLCIEEIETAIEECKYGKILRNKRPYRNSAAKR